MMFWNALALMFVLLIAAQPLAESEGQVICAGAWMQEEEPQKSPPSETRKQRVERYIRALAHMRRGETTKARRLLSFSTEQPRVTLPKEDLLAHFDAAKGVEVIQGRVKSWADQSGQGNHANQENERKRPVPLTACGSEYLRFNGRAFLTLPAIAGRSDDLAAFVVCQSDMDDRRGSEIILSLRGKKTHFNLMLLKKAGVTVVRSKNVTSNLAVGTSLTALGCNSEPGSLTSFCAAESQTGEAAKKFEFGEGGFIGAVPGSKVAFHGLIRAIVLYGKKQSPESIKRIRSFLTQEYGCCSPDEKNFICCDGDSLTQAKAALNQGYDRQLAHLFPSQPKITNVAVGGQSVASMASKAFDLVDREFIQNSAYPNQIGILWGGSNDLEGGDTAYNIKRHTRGWIEGRQTLGVKTVILTVLPRADLKPEEEKIRLEFNDWIRAGTSRADIVVDVAADPRLQNPGDQTWFAADKIHLSAAGQGIVAAHVRAALEPLMKR